LKYNRSFVPRDSSGHKWNRQFEALFMTSMLMIMRLTCFRVGGRVLANVAVRIHYFPKLMASFYILNKPYLRYAMREARVAHDVGNILAVFCFTFLAVCCKRPPGLTRASQKIRCIIIIETKYRESKGKWKLDKILFCEYTCTL